MKKIAWSACILAGTLALAGCAGQKKPLSEQLPPRPAVTQQEAAASDLSAEGSQPESLATTGPVSGEIVEKNIEVAPSLQYINDRIAEYERKLERWKELDGKRTSAAAAGQEPVETASCLRQLQNVLQGYSELRERVMQAELTPSTSQSSGLSVVELQKSDIEFMESRCSRLLVEPEESPVEVGQKAETADLAQLEAQIDQYFAGKQYQEVARVGQKIPPAQLGRVNLMTRLHYGNALIYVNQHAKAAEIYQQVVDQLSAPDQPAIDLVSLRKMLADLYMATGNNKAAAAQYQRVGEDYRKIGRLDEWSKLQLSILDRSAEAGPEMREYSSLLRSYLGFMPQEDGYKVLWQAEKYIEQYPSSPVSANVAAIKENVLAAADAWFENSMAAVDKLSSEKKFKEALEKLEAIPTSNLRPDQQLVVKSRSEELQQGKEADRETGRMVQAQELQVQWDRGVLLAGEEKYDEAITVFSGLLDSEFSAKAAEKIKEVSLAAAQADRKKAANLFVRFTKTADLESKKKLLLESRRILKNILVKYPNVEIGPKVVGNIERVEQEMVAIDPAMLVMADQDDPQPAGGDSADRAFAPRVPGQAVGGSPAKQ